MKANIILMLTLATIKIPKINIFSLNSWREVE